MWPEPGSNWRPHTFQACALPTELSGQKPQVTSATLTGLEPATSAVTGRRANQLRHRAIFQFFVPHWARIVTLHNVAEIKQICSLTAVFSTLAHQFFKRPHEATQNIGRRTRKDFRPSHIRRCKGACACRRRLFEPSHTSRLQRPSTSP